MKITLVRTRKEHFCEWCGQDIPAGSMAQNSKIVGTIEGHFHSHSGYMHCRCYYKQQSHNKRFERFQERCEHPEPFIGTVWSGDAPPVPEYDECLLCRGRV